MNIQYRKKYLSIIAIILLFFSIWSAVSIIKEGSNQQKYPLNLMDKASDNTMNSAFWGKDESITDANGSIIIPDWNEVLEIKNSIKIVGDINDDGYDDILIGNETDDEGGIDAGQTYLFFGSPSGFSEDMSFSDANASFIGEGAYDNSGCSVAGIGDVNGDEISDFLIGAENNTGHGNNEGKVYLFFGNTTDIWTMGMSLSDANASFIGNFTGASFGHNVAGAGDINNDGKNDFLIGADKANASFYGGVYLFLGNDTDTWSKNTNCTEANITFMSEEFIDSFGESIAGVGKINEDNFDDILISAPFNDENGNEAGKVYLFFGSDTNVPSLISASDANASFFGEGAGNYFGYSVARAGDVNADGYDDFLMGTLIKGKAYLFFGNDTNTWSKNVNSSKANATFFQEGSMGFGRSLTGAGDVNADGYDDFLIGDVGYNESGNDEGKAYIFYGNETNIWKLNFNCIYANASFVGDSDNTYVGYIVGGFGDVNGDTGDDILITGFNKTYILFGNAPPVFAEVPNNISYAFGDSGNTLEWNVTDSSIDNATYTVYDNSNPLVGEVDQEWTSGVNISVSVDGLSVGVHNISIIVKDGLGASAQDDVGVTVTNTALSHYGPTPSDIEYPYGSTGNEIVWNYTDASVSSPNYTVYNNSNPVSEHTDQSWTSGIPITVDVDGLSVGDYNFTIIVEDGLGEIVQDEVNVTVTSDAPTHSGPTPSDFPYEFGSSNNEIVWNFTDATTSGPNYTVYLDSNPYSTYVDQPWSSGAPITVDVDGLSIGSYNFTIVVWDGLGESTQDEVNVTVTNEAPTYNSLPNDVGYTVNTTGHTITWTFTDVSTSSPNYTVYLNTTPYTGYINQAWSSGDPIVVNIDNLTVGMHNFTIVIWDGLGETFQDEVWVTVSEQSGFLPILPQSEEEGFFTQTTIIILSIIGSVAVLGIVLGVVLYKRSLYY